LPTKQSFMGKLTYRVSTFHRKLAVCCSPR
jgi:hypothetical protein